MIKVVDNQHPKNKFTVCWRDFWEGMTSVLDIIPPPSQRRYRPYLYRQRLGSLQEDQRALYSDRMKVRKDFHKALEVMKQKTLTEEHE